MSDRKVYGDRRRRGSGLLEFAVVTFSLFLVVFAAIEFCRMALVYSSIASAARVAVRFATVTGDDGLGNGNTQSSDAEICAVVTKYTAGLNTAALTCNTGATTGSRIVIQRSAVVVSGQTIAAGQPGSLVMVKVVYRYDPFFSLLPLNVNLGTQTQGYILY